MTPENETRTLVWTILFFIAAAFIVGFLMVTTGCRYILPGHGTMRDIGELDGKTHGIYVAKNGFPVNQAEMDAVVEETILDWGRVLGVEQVREALRSRGDYSNYIGWKTFPFEHPQCPAAVGGKPHTCYELTLDGRRALVGFKEPLSESALRTGVGNIIWFRLKWKPSRDGSTEQTLNDFAREHHIRR